MHRMCCICPAQVLCAEHTISCAVHADTWYAYRSVEAFPGMSAMGLRMEPVEGDGNCLFRSFAVLRPEKDHRQWREELVNLLEGIATAEHKEHVYLGRANIQLESRLWKTVRSARGIPTRKLRLYPDFSSLMKDMRKEQWGWGDFIDLFSLVNKVAVVCFQASDRFIYNRHRAVDRIKETLFLVNVQDTQGMCCTWNSMSW